ncbi:MAG: hypothetical protein HDS70_02265 [Bacteroidales bacterium]|nr:hypothetical protein [Bacteroidales bacterium]
MSIANSLKTLLSQTAASCASLIKIALQSRPVGKTPVPASGRDLLILGNGPSLTDTLENHPDFIRGKDLLAVNFAANAPLFESLRPNLYVLADPHFFLPGDDEKVYNLWRRLGAASWDITLFIPTRFRKEAERLLTASSSKHLTTATFNLTPIEGFSKLKRFAFRHSLGMPRPRNVLIPSIMTGLRLGYKRIYIAGADHSWSRTLWVDDSNRVVTVQPHFYPDDEKERERVTAAYAGIHLHDIYTSFAIAFRSYFEIEAYASALGVEIINVTPGSFIDAFARLKL